MSTSRWLLLAFSLLLFLGLIWLWQGDTGNTSPSASSSGPASTAMDLQGTQTSPTKKPTNAPQKEQLTGGDNKAKSAPELYPTPENPKQLSSGLKVARGPVGTVASRQPRTWYFDSEKLDALAYTDTQIDRIYAGWEAAIDLRGPYMTKGHDTLLSQNESPMRAEMGDADYDAALYAAGIENRVVISRVVSGEAAELAGVLPGDRLISYNGERIFGMRELSFVLGATEPRDLIDILVQHPNGELEQLRIPGGWAGPGFELNRSSEPPPRF